MFYSKTTGQYHSVKGTAVEAVGNLIGSQNLRSSGKEEHQRGEAELQAAKAQGYVEGVTDRATGRKDAVVGAITGDTTQQTSGMSK